MHTSAFLQRAPVLAAPFRSAPEREWRQGPAVPAGGAGTSFAFANVAVHAPAPKRSAKDDADAGGTRDAGIADAGTTSAGTPDAGAVPADAGKPPVAGPPQPAPAPPVTPIQPPPPAAPPCPPGAAYAPGKAVAPNYVVNRPPSRRSNSDPSTTHADDPTLTGHPATDCAAGLWHYEPDAIESKGTIQLVYYTDDHYPAPTPTDDSGALSNVTQANYKTITNDLRTNKNGIPTFWSAYQRESLHEDYHWNHEWQGEVNKEVPNALAEIAKLTVPFATAATAAAADAVLAPLAKTEFDKAMKRARTAYNALGDSPGDPPYVAQAPALEALATRVDALATTNKWP